MSGPSPDRIRLFLCGDVMTGRGVDQALPHPSPPELREPFMTSAAGYLRLAEQVSGPIHRPVSPSYPWGEAQAEWARMSPDLRLINLETAITHSDDFAPKGIHYRMAPENAACLTTAGLDACALANNHVLDFGPTGLVETLEVLRGLGIRSAGAGRNLAEASAPCVLPLAGRRERVILLAACFEDSGVPASWRARPDAPGVHLVAPDETGAAELGARLREASSPGDVAVVSLHWGSNWGYQVPARRCRFAHALIDTGQVAIVHGHSSHHPRPIEIYRDRLILYGCGDFLNDYEGIGGYEEFRSQLVAMYFADLDGRTGALRDLVLTPLKLCRLQLRPADAADAAWLAYTLTRESKAFGVSVALDAEGRLRATRRA